MNQPRVSFVVLSYNYAHFIGETIQSILDQRGNHDFEVIVVDDASPDNSDEVIRRFTDPRIRYFRHEKNQGHAATVTDGLREARGEIVARIDSDDRYRPDFLNTVLPHFDDPTVGLVYGDAAIIDENGQVASETTDVIHEGADHKGNEFVKLLETNFICAPTIIARRQAWLDALPIPPWLVFHDWWFTTMIGRRHDFYYCAQVLADYRVHQTNYHTHIAKNKSEEASIIGMLDGIYATKEADPALERSKQDAKSRIYAAHYRTLASKYFWFHNNADARRCFAEAIKRRPSLILDPVIARQFAATIMGRGIYEKLKGVR